MKEYREEKVEILPTEKQRIRRKRTQNRSKWKSFNRGSSADVPTKPPEFIKTKPTLTVVQHEDKMPEVPLTGALFFNKSFSILSIVTVAQLISANFAQLFFSNTSPLCS